MKPSDVVNTLPVSVLIRTIGRPDRLRECLGSLALCSPRATEIVIVDQSADRATADVVAGFRDIGARRVPCTRRGRSLAMNVGLIDAVHDVVLVTDDDCTVAPDWVAVGSATALRGRLVTGRVLPKGDPASVPSTIADPVRHTFSSRRHCGRLLTNNMVCYRDEVLTAGGFDERIQPYSEDSEFCYRWLKTGRDLLYEPDLVVWHHDWRTVPELVELYVDYAYSRGMFYAKHLRQGDLMILAFIAFTTRTALAGEVAGLLGPPPPWPDQRRGLVRGLPRGLADGWRIFGPGSRPEEPAAVKPTRLGPDAL
jgi:GT2 family glycosyltransferase